MLRKEKNLDISSYLSFFSGVIFAGIIVWSVFFYSNLEGIPIVSDFFKPPSHLSYEWVGLRLILIGVFFCVVIVGIKGLWELYQHKKS